MTEKVKPLFALKNLTLKAGILGISGYTGQELIRLLINHPVISIRALFYWSNNSPISEWGPDLAHYSLPEPSLFDVALCGDLDVLFLAVPHTSAIPIVSSLRLTYPNLKIVDLSADFRLSDVSIYESYYGVSHQSPLLLNEAVYGLPEKYFSDIKGAHLVANPGCYATSMILGLLPLVNHVSLSHPITIDAKSGTSGAGRTLKAGSLFCEVHDTFLAYSTGKHRHMAELIQETGFSKVMFSPHLLPIVRGIESAIYIHDIGLSVSRIHQLFYDYYIDHPFVDVLHGDAVPNLKMVQRTNRCVIIPKVIDDCLVVFSLIDNLGKGASGQAIQNANIMFGLEQTTGL